MLLSRSNASTDTPVDYAENTTYKQKKCAAWFGDETVTGISRKRRITVRCAPRLGACERVNSRQVPSIIRRKDAR